MDIDLILLDLELIVVFLGGCLIQFDLGLLC